MTRLVGEILKEHVMMLMDNVHVKLALMEKIAPLNWQVRNYEITRKYPLHGHILGVLKRITAKDQHWEGDKILKRVLICVAWLHLA